MGENLQMRIFYFEPFLIKAERHFIETSLAISKYLSDNPKYKLFLVGNKNADKNVIKLFPSLIKGISQTCFEDLDNQGESFFRDLISLHNKFDFTSSDLIIIPTSYENQILGVGKYVSIVDSHKCPMIAMEFHQLFPPVPESDDVAKISFRKFWKRRLSKAFETLHRNNLSIWTTESGQLNNDFQKLFGGFVGILPVQYSRPKEVLSSKPIAPFKINKNQEKYIKVAFLGEGRQEKGLLYFLEAIEILNKHENQFLFVIQNMNPRGYTKMQKKRFEYLMSRIQKYKNVIILDGGIEPNQFHKILSWIDVLVLPYNPINYCRRVSGLIIHAALYNKSVITSSGTWGAEAVNKKWASGTVFSYKVSNKKLTIQNLTASINGLRVNMVSLKERAKLYSQHFSGYNTAEEYIQRIVSYYDKKS